MKDTIQINLEGLINQPKNLSFLADEERGLVTIHYTYKGERCEAHENIEHFKIFLRVAHRDYIEDYNLCTRGEPIYNWNQIFWDIPSELPAAIFQFLKSIKKF